MSRRHSTRPEKTPGRDRSSSNQLSHTSQRAVAALILLLAIATLFACWPTPSSEFVFDDQQYITDNPHVRTGISLENVVWALTSTYASNWHPLTWISHMLDVEFWGMSAYGHRLTSLLLHLANTMLLFLVLRYLTGETIKSWVVAALFGLHPLHVESVAWVAERKDVLSTFFALLAIAAYARQARKPGKWNLVILYLAYVCSLMSKPMTVTLPFVLLLLDFWPLSRLEFGVVRRGSRPRGGLAHLLWEKAPLLLLSALSSAVTYAAQQKALGHFALSARLSNALLSYVRYGVKVVVPTDLAVHYPFPVTTHHGPALGAGLLLAGSVVLAIREARRHPYLTVGWFWYLGTLVPVIGIVQVGSQAMADRYMYLPSIGVFLLVVWLSAAIAPASLHRMSTFAPGVAAILLLLLTLTRIQTNHWRNGLTLFEHAAKVAPHNRVAHYQLGLALTGKGRPDEAILQYQEALRIEPRDAEARYNIGTILLHKGRIQEAADSFRHALSLEPDFVDAHNNLGVALFQQGRLEEARQHLSTVLNMNPSSASGHGNLAAVLAAMGQEEEAIFHLREVIRLDPLDARAPRMLGEILARQNKIEDGIPISK